MSQQLFGKGGKRVGAGRKAINPIEKRVTLSVRVKPITLETIRGRKNMSAGGFIDTAVSAFKEHCFFCKGPIDSIYGDDGSGPYCLRCWQELGEG
jgi:hypothetical protein